MTSKKVQSTPHQTLSACVVSACASHQVIWIKIQILRASKMYMTPFSINVKKKNQKTKKKQKKTSETIQPAPKFVCKV